MIRGGNGKLKGRRNRRPSISRPRTRIARLMRRGGMAAVHNFHLYIALGIMWYVFEDKYAPFAGLKST